MQKFQVEDVTKVYERHEHRRAISRVVHAAKYDFEIEGDAGHLKQGTKNA